MEFGVFKMTFTVAALFLIGASARPEMPHSGFRLPSEFKPISYDLTVITHLEDKFQFEGVVHIKVSGRDVALSLYEKIAIARFS